MKNVKFRGKTPIPWLGSKFRGPRKIVGPSDNILTLATSAPRSAVRKNLTILAETSLPPRRAVENLPPCRPHTSLPPPRPPAKTLPLCRGQPSLPPRRAVENLPLCRWQTSLPSAARRGKPPKRG